MFYAIDVSKWQGAMNWATVKNAGVRHAMIRAGYGNSVLQTDPQFKRNAAACEGQGIHWGAVLVLVAILLDDYIRWRFFGEEKPHYTL